MDIGTAKATKEERAAVHPHMIDVISPKESFSAKNYRDMAIPIAREIEGRGAIPLFVGGTGLYLSTLLRPECEEPPASDPNYRLRYADMTDTEAGRQMIWQMLRERDPESADAVHYNNVRRVIRALEIFDATGKPKSYFDKLSQTESGEISVTHVTLDFHDRATLYSRVDERVSAMLDMGLIEETKGLIMRGELDPAYTAAQAIGYKEIIGAVLGDSSFEDAIEGLKQATRNYAKRQLTWFRNMKGAIPVFADREDGSMRGADEICLEIANIFKQKNKNLLYRG